MTVHVIEAQYANLREVAQRLRIHTSTALKLVQRNQLPVVKVGSRYYVRRDDLERFAMTYDNRPGRKPIRRLL